MLYPWTINIHRDAITAIYQLDRRYVVLVRNSIAQLSNNPMPEGCVEHSDNIYTLDVTQCPVQIVYHLNEEHKIVIIRQISATE